MLHEVKELLLKEINDSLNQYGYTKISTCDTNSYGWSLEKHLAMQQISRNPPVGVHVTGTVSFGVNDWTITKVN